jgi:hypothetical protein
MRFLNQEFNMKKEKEIGINKNTSKAAKDLDDRVDQKHGIKEGSAKDLKVDRKINKDDKTGRLKSVEKY